MELPSAYEQIHIFLFSSATGGVMPSPGPTSSGTAEVIQGAGRPPLPPRPGSTANQAGYGYGSGRYLAVQKTNEQ